MSTSNRNMVRVSISVGRGDWAKIVSKLDRTQKAGYAIDGEFWGHGEERDVAVGTIVVKCKKRRRSATLSIMQVTADGELEAVDHYEWPQEQLSALDKIEELLNQHERMSPLAGFDDEQLLDELRARGYRL